LIFIERKRNCLGLFPYLSSVARRGGLGRRKLFYLQYYFLLNGIFFLIREPRLLCIAKIKLVLFTFPYFRFQHWFFILLAISFIVVDPDPHGSASN
jgi:hypothetical protein